MRPPWRARRISTCRRPGTGRAPYVEAGQRIFFDLTPVLRSRPGRAIVPRVFDVMEARSAAVLRRLFADPRFSVDQQIAVAAPAPHRPGGGAVQGPGDAAPRPVPARGGPAPGRPCSANELRAALVVPAGATAVQRLDHVERILGRERLPGGSRHPAAAARWASPCWRLAGRLAGTPRRTGALQTVLRGLPNNVTTEMDLDLWRSPLPSAPTRRRRRCSGAASLPELARRTGPARLPAVVQSGLAGFLGRYGHRAVAEIDLGMPRWSDDPTHILGVLANYLRAGGPRRSRRTGSSARRRARRRRRWTGWWPRRGRAQPPARGAGAGRAAADPDVRRAARTAEVPPRGSARRGRGSSSQAVGARTGRAPAAIDAADDVFFLDLAEAHAGARRRRAAGPRGAAPGGVRGRTGPPAHPAGAALGRHRARGGADRRCRRAEARRRAGRLSGTPASAGTVTARARVILDPQGAHLEPGEILVAPSTDPGWTPLFLTAGGLVMEMGGPNSHGAVVAREYGIPAVVGVPDATSRITTGPQHYGRRRRRHRGAGGRVQPGSITGE